MPSVESLRDTPFLASFMTPLLKVTKKGKKNQVFAFYSMAEYNAWRGKMEEPHELKQWTIKYYGVQGFRYQYASGSERVFRSFY